MIKEFEGKTEQEAIEKAIDELHIEREDFDVEVVDNGRHGLFKKGNVKIRVHIDTAEEETVDYKDYKDYKEPEAEESEPEEVDLPEDPEIEAKACEFIEGTVSHMGYECKATVTLRKGCKVYINVESESSNIIIGRKGKNLDALQVLVNVFVGKFNSDYRYIVDSENYRVRHEEQIIKDAYHVAQMVKKSGRSRLLEPMNPYERRLVHTALNDVTGIETKSEGEGLIKQVRIIAKKKY